MLKNEYTKTIEEQKLVMNSLNEEVSLAHKKVGIYRNFHSVYIYLGDIKRKGINPQNRIRSLSG